jgi:hypothetical protein
MQGGGGGGGGASILTSPPKVGAGGSAGNFTLVNVIAYRGQEIYFAIGEGGTSGTSTITAVQPTAGEAGGISMLRLGSSAGSQLGTVTGGAGGATFNYNQATSNRSGGRGAGYKNQAGALTVGALGGVGVAAGTITGNSGSVMIENAEIASILTDNIGVLFSDPNNQLVKFLNTTGGAGGTNGDAVKIVGSGGGNTEYTFINDYNGGNGTGYISPYPTLGYAGGGGGGGFFARGGSTTIQNNAETTTSPQRGGGGAAGWVTYANDLYYSTNGRAGAAGFGVLFYA